MGEKKYSVESFKNAVAYLQKRYFLSMRGYDAFHYLEQPLITYMRNSAHTSLKELLAPCFFQTYDYLWGYMSKKTILFLSNYYSPRKDMHTIYNNICMCVDNSYELRGKFTRKFRPLYLLNFFRAIVWLFQLRGLKLNFTGKLYLVSYLAMAVNFRKMLEDNETNISEATAFVSLNDENYDENIFVQFCKQHSIPTATLQHGHFLHSTYDGNLFGITNAFENFSSDVFFAWGEYSKREAQLSGIPESHILTVGNPKFIRFNDFPIPGDNRVFGVVLDGGGTLFLESNKGMLACADRIAEQYGYKYIIRPHPVYDMSLLDGEYNPNNVYGIYGKDKAVYDFATSVCFSFASGSSVYAELLYMHQFVFRYVHPSFKDRYYGIDTGLCSDPASACACVEEYEYHRDVLKTKLALHAEELCGEGDIEENYKQAIAELNNKHFLEVQYNENISNYPRERRK